jgi:antitoxin MazE
MTMLTKIGNSQGIRIPKPIKKVSRKDWEKNIKEVILKNLQEDEAILQEWLDEELDEWEW